MTRKISEETKAKNRERAKLWIKQNPEKHKINYQRYTAKRKEELKILRQTVQDIKNKLSDQ